MSEPLFIILSGTAISVLLCGSLEYIKGIREERQINEKKQLLKQLIKNRNLDYPVHKTVEMCPMIFADTDECIISLSYADCFRETVRTVGEIFTDHYYREFISEAGYHGREAEML